MVLILLLVIAGCSNQLTCNEPYIIKGLECCLDVNSDKICDSDQNITNNSFITDSDEACFIDDNNITVCGADFIGKELNDNSQKEIISDNYIGDSKEDTSAINEETHWKQARRLPRAPCPFSDSGGS